MSFFARTCQTTLGCVSVIAALNMQACLSLPGAGSSCLAHLYPADKGLHTMGTFPLCCKAPCLRGTPAKHPGAALTWPNPAKLKLNAGKTFQAKQIASRGAYTISTEADKYKRSYPTLSKLHNVIRSYTCT